MKNLLILALLVGLVACQPTNENLSAIAKEEILAAEKAFNQMAADSGVQKAFLYYAHDSAVIVREKRMIKGKADMKLYFAEDPLQNIRIEWSPDFVDASRSGDMGYTYGRYHFTANDSSGQLIASEGVFHTVWQKDKDGEWRFVYD